MTDIEYILRDTPLAPTDPEAIALLEDASLAEAWATYNAAESHQEQVYAADELNELATALWEARKKTFDNSRPGE